MWNGGPQITHCCLRGDRTAIFIHCHKWVAKSLAFKRSFDLMTEMLCYQAKETAPLRVRYFVVKQRRRRPSIKKETAFAES